MNREDIEKEASKRYKHPQIDNMDARGHQAFCEGALWMQKTAIDNCVKWCEQINKNSERLGQGVKIDVDDFRKFITNVICGTSMWDSVNDLINEYEKERKYETKRTFKVK